MLKSTKMENESSTAQLNLDLENARSQVRRELNRSSFVSLRLSLFDRSKTCNIVSRIWR